METNTKRVNRRRLTGFFLTMMMLISLFSDFASTAYAGVTTGASGTINATGYKTGLNGGVKHIDKPVFRVGIMRDKSMYNNTSAQARTDIINAFAHRYPDNNESLFFTPNGYASTYSNYEVGRYVPSTRKMAKYSDSVSLARVQNLQTSGSTKPTAYGKNLISDFSFSGAGTTRPYSELAGGKWKSRANQITSAQANAFWSYVLAETSGGYDIETRLNAMISPHADRNLTYSTVTDADREDVARGYLGAMMTTWRLVPASLKAPWEQAIEDYLTNSKQARGEQPSTIVIDTAMTLGFNSTGKQLVMPTIDYFHYYSAVGTKWNLHKTTDALVQGARGDTHNLMVKIVQGDINEAGSINRTSDRFDAANVFSFASSAIARPNYQFFTYNNTAKWQNVGTAVAIMDVLTLGTHSNGGKLRGFILAGLHLDIGSEEPIKPGQPAGKANVKFTATPDSHPVPATSDVLAKQVTLTFKHSSDASIISSWQKIFLAEPTANKTINVKITPNRTASPTAKVAPAYTSSTGNLISGVNMTQANFIAFLQGKMPLTILDNTVNEPIAQGSTMTYTYKPKFEISYMLNGKASKVTLDLSDTASFKRPKLPPDPIIFTSEPSAYAELKEGTPDNETFEAMAGVPSNKRLYLGVGGSEYVVDVELEYKENVDSVWRKYRSFYSAVDSEHKAGDTAGSYTVGGNSVNAHTGGTTTKNWSGSVPWTGSVTYSDHTTSVTNTWDMTAANAAKAEADAWAATVNGTVISHTSSSDTTTRTFSSWGAVTTGSASNGTPGTASPGRPEVWGTCPDGTNPDGTPKTKPCITQTYIKSSGTNGTDGSYSYTVTGTIPPHKICGPECNYVLPAIEDTWKQKVNFDYMKISRVEVYKIEEGRVTSVDNLFGTGNSTLQATIQSTDPTTFFNIAQKNANGNDVEAQSSKFGRIRYSLDGNQHDFVEYNEGVRTNKSAGQGTNGVTAAIGQTHARAGGILYTNTAYTDVKDFHKTTANATDELRPEFIKFNQRRTALNKATVISDMLILQTSSGDQAVMYFDKATPDRQAQEQFPDVNATKAEMWDNNPNSAFRWRAEQINVGSYNGKYLESGGTNRKYSGYNLISDTFLTSKPSIPTAFDSNGVGVNAGTPRPTKPNKLYMYGSRAIEPTTPNASYEVGDAEVFYERVLSWATPNPYPSYGASLQDNMYDAQVQANFGSKTGFVLQAPYSEDHDKVNDVVIHTPVSVQDATLIALPSDRDQRTATPAGGADELIQEQNALKVCPLDPALCEFRVLNCKHRLDTVLAEIDFDNSTTTTVLNKTTGAQIPYTTSTGITMANKAGFGSGKSLNAFGTRWSLDFADIGVTNDKHTTILVEMDFWMPSPASGETMIVSFEGYDFYVPTGGIGTWNTGNGVEKRLDGVNFKDNKMRLGLQISLGHIDDSKVFVNGIEQTTYTKVSESSDVVGKVGTKLNIGSWGTDGNYPAQFYVDNLKITRKGGTLSHTAACYITTVTHETKWTHVHDASCYETSAPTTQTFNYTGGVQTFTAPHTGTYSLETWGAQGGTYNASYPGGKGGYAKGDITLTKGEVISLYVGGQGGNQLAGLGGYNGGGKGFDAGQGGAGGGGATDIRKGGTSLTNRIIVGGGGGGGTHIRVGGHGGGVSGQKPDITSTYSGGGATQTSGGTAGSSGAQVGTLGQGGDSQNDDGAGGGGGFYGGGGGSNDHGGGGGSGYIGGVTGGTMTADSRTGHGQAKITSTGGTGTKLICNNLPLNLLTQNNVHVHDASCITEVKDTPTAKEIDVPVAPVSLGSLNIYGVNSTLTNLAYNPTWNNTYNVSDVLVGKDYIYVVHMNMDYVSQYNKNSDGTIGSLVRTNSWYGADTTIGQISVSSSSVPYAFALVVENGADKLVGWSGNSSTIFTWDINPSTNTPTNRQSYSAPTPIGSYSRGGWDGNNTVYFFNRNNNNLFAWDLTNKSAPPTVVTTLANGANYISSSWSGSGMLVDEDKGHVFASSGSNQTEGFITGWNLSTGTMLTGTNPIRGAQFSMAGITPINGEVGHVSLNAVNRNVAFYFSNYQNKLVTLNVGENGKVMADGTAPIRGTSTNFNYTGGVQTFTVPTTGDYELETWGAQGGTMVNDPWGYNNQGGKGGYTKGTVTLTKGDVLSIYVGGQGANSGTSQSYSVTAGGWNGGGRSYSSGSTAGGGGATDIRKGGTALTNRIIVAGGGGGAGYYTNGVGGDGGGATAPKAQDHSWGTGAGGGTQTTGGTGGPTFSTSGYNVENGSLGLGGGGVGNGVGGGGGGGGYYGGQGGYISSGAGGSSYVGSLTNSTMAVGLRTGNGSVKITPLTLPDDSNGFGNYTWEEIFGPNWQTYVKETTTSTTVGGGAPQTFAYSTTTRTFNVPTTGDYTLEVWGAVGGPSRNAVGGNGGYAKGTIALIQGDTLTIITGGKGGGSSSTGYWSSRASGGFNGGGSSGSDSDGNDNNNNETGGGGGGFTIIKRGTTTLLAGGGGGGGNYSSSGGSGSAGGGGGGSYGNSGGSGTGMNETGNVKIGGDGGSGVGAGYVNGLTAPVTTSGVNNADGYATITSLPKVVTTTETKVDWVKVKADVAIANFPQKMSDGKPNPIFAEDAQTYNVHVHTAACVTTKTLACSEPHHSGAHYDGSNPICWDACGLDHNHQQLKPTSTKPDGSLVQAGSFVNMDYPFQIYFPNRGDFAQQVDLRGLGSVTTTRGAGYVNSMDTTQYTAGKRVKFEFNVAFNGQIYTSGSWIDLPVNQEVFDFNVPLANSEAIGASVQFDVVPINGSPIGEPQNDNFYTVTNRERNYDFTSYHGAFKESYIDLVGRIGNFVVSDTEDFRFSNTFKQDSPSGNWLVEGLVKEVDSDRQKKYYGDMVDLRGFNINSTGTRLDTYGSQPWLRQAPLAFPVNPKDNDNAALKEEFLKVGYDILGDIQTTGNYQDGVVRVLPYYYKLDVDTGVITPLDVHVKNGADYKPVNFYRGADGGSLPSNLNPYDLILDWAKEAPRRNFTMDESIITDRVAQIHGEYILGQVDIGGGVMAEGVTGVKRLTTPLGNFVNVGNAQRIVVDRKARTFIGSSQTNGVEMNLGNALPQDDWEYAAQRWHMKLGLPSSSVFVPAGQPVNEANVNAVKSGNGVILLAADIISIGEMYSLRWTQPGISSFTVTKGGVTRPFNIAGSGLPPVIALYDLDSSAVIDVTVQGSH